MGTFKVSNRLASRFAILLALVFGLWPSLRLANPMALCAGQEARGCERSSSDCRPCCPERRAPPPAHSGGGEEGLPSPQSDAAVWDSSPELTARVGPAESAPTLRERAADTRVAVQEASPPVRLLASTFRN